MATLTVNRVITVAILMTAHVALAEGPMTAHWNEVCRLAGGRELSITTTSGETVQGYCLAINVDGITVWTRKHRTITIARSMLARILMRANRGHALESLGKGIATALRQSRALLLTPAAPVGVVLAPGALAWGALAAPFCLAGDLQYKIAGGKEIKVL